MKKFEKRLKRIWRILGFLLYAGEHFRLIFDDFLATFFPEKPDDEKSEKSK